MSSTRFVAMEVPMTNHSSPRFLHTTNPSPRRELRRDELAGVSGGMVVSTAFAPGNCSPLLSSWSGSSPSPSFGAGSFAGSPFGAGSSGAGSSGGGSSGGGGFAGGIFGGSPTDGHASGGDGGLAASLPAGAGTWGGGAGGALGASPAGSGSYVHADWQPQAAAAPTGGDAWSQQAQSLHTGGGILPTIGAHGGSEEQCTTTTSFDIRNWGDPHQSITINDRALGQIDNPQSIDNFETFNHTVGGPTTISTQTTDQSTEGLSFNREVDIHGGSWGLAATSGSGGVGATIQDSHGTWALQAGQSITENDGTTITNNGGSLSVTEHLQDGGSVSTEISLNGSGYLDFESQGHGDAGLAGWAVDHWKNDGAAR